MAKQKIETVDSTYPSISDVTVDNWVDRKMQELRVLVFLGSEAFRARDDSDANVKHQNMFYRQWTPGDTGYGGPKPDPMFR